MARINFNESLINTLGLSCINFYNAATNPSNGILSLINAVTLSCHHSKILICLLVDKFSGKGTEETSTAQSHMPVPSDCEGTIPLRPSERGKDATLS